MIRVSDLSLAPGQEERELLPLAARALGLRTEQIQQLRIHKKSVDARKKQNIRVRYTVDVALRSGARLGRRARFTEVSEQAYHPPVTTARPDLPPVVTGFGPAGMFAALTLALAGLRPIVLERGCDVDSRTRAVERFWSTGQLDETSNVQFGEGGAGTFSDGKLTTGINDGRIRWILQTLCDLGAQENILYDARPHIGTDVLRSVVRALREKVIGLGGTVRFGARVTDWIIENGSLAAVKINGVETLPCNDLILAVGHSARDTFARLLELGVPMCPKPFSMGVRIEHSQKSISQAQYGEAWRKLPPADYKLSCRFPEGDSAYTFCMCPGGFVVGAASEAGGVCTNGMSYADRGGENANAALLVTLTPDMFPDRSVLGGMAWQRELERAAFRAGGGAYYAPAQRVGDFLAGRPSTGPGSVLPTYRPGVTWCDLHDVLPTGITRTLEKAIPELGKKLRGFDDPDAVLTAVEARSSSPVRILRGEELCSEIAGLYPCGEGAGYAGGIVSAAVDGIKCAEKIIEKTERAGA